MTLLQRHLAFIEALRTAGLPVSLSEDLDSVAAVSELGLHDRESLRAALAATLVKRQQHRPSFDALFDLWYPGLVGAGARAAAAGALAVEDDGDGTRPPASSEELLARLRERITEALAADDSAALDALAVEAVQELGGIEGRRPGQAGQGGPGRQPGQPGQAGGPGQRPSSWSSYNTLQRLSPDTLVLRLTRALLAQSGAERRSEDAAFRTARVRVDGLRGRVESEVRRRIAEEKGPEHVARTTLRPSLDQLDFTAARKTEIDEMRRQVYPLARRLASRLAREQHARRRGPLDFRRTVRASISTGGVPLTTHHRPRRPHRPELVVLCDVSGSVASFAQFTLLLVYALREQFGNVRAFTFVDTVHEVTGEFRPGADPELTMLRLAASARHAMLWGRTDYGRAFRTFLERHADALTPKTSLLVLGDARSNYTDPGLDALRTMVAATRHAWWLNPEHPRQWDTGDSAASAYAGVVPMVECRNLTQLTEFVHDLV